MFVSVCAEAVLTPNGSKSKEFSALIWNKNSKWKFHISTAGQAVTEREYLEACIPAFLQPGRDCSAGLCHLRETFLQRKKGRSCISPHKTCDYCFIILLTDISRSMIKTTRISAAATGNHLPSLQRGFHLILNLACEPCDPLNRSFLFIWKIFRWPPPKKKNPLWLIRKKRMEETTEMFLQHLETHFCSFWCFVVVNCYKLSSVVFHVLNFTRSRLPAAIEPDLYVTFGSILMLKWA